MPSKNYKYKYPASFPQLRLNGDKGKFNIFTDKQRAAVVWAWLVEGTATRQIDKEFLDKDPDKYKGFYSMNICHYLGIYAPHQGFFQGCSQIEVIRYLLKYAKQDSTYYPLLYYISLHTPEIKKITQTQTSFDVNFLDKLPYDREQYWIRRNLLEGINEQQINARLLWLPDVKDKGNILVNNILTEYSNLTVQTTIKDVYDHTCQICGCQHHDNAWNANSLRIDQWLHMNSEIHFITSLNQGGSYGKENMLCLCHKCAEKIKSGQYHLIEKNGIIRCLDEQNGKKEKLIIKHRISLAG